MLAFYYERWGRIPSSARFPKFPALRVHGPPKGLIKVNPLSLRATYKKLGDISRQLLALTYL